MKNLEQGPYQEIPDRCYSQRKELDYTQPSVQGMMYINQLFHLEDGIKAKYTSFDTIKKARLEKEKPIVESFLSWLDKKNPFKGTRMDKAVTYIQNRRN